MAEQHNHLYLVDGSSYIFRAYHRLPPLTNRHGMNVGAVYGYTTMLWKLADGLNKADGPTHMAVILDKSEHTFRNEMYDQYKAHRPPAPEDLVPQFPLIRTATRAFSIPCIETEGLEADDIIACYVKAALAAGWSISDCFNLGFLIASVDASTVSRSPYSTISWLAVFGPIPGTPGTLSTLSPISARTSPSLSGKTSNLAFT